jgi:hypothetical protein
VNLEPAECWHSLVSDDWVALRDQPPRQTQIDRSRNQYPSGIALRRGLTDGILYHVELATIASLNPTINPHFDRTRSLVVSEGSATALPSDILHQFLWTRAGISKDYVSIFEYMNREPDATRFVSETQGSGLLACCDILRQELTPRLETALEDEFLSRYRESAETALESLQVGLRLSQMTPANATTILLRALASAPPAQQEPLMKTIANVASPDGLISIALSQYAATANEELLLAAADALLRMSTRAWPALRNLAETQPPHCEAFISTIARMPDIPPEERVSTLKRLATSADEKIRRAVTHSARRLPPDDRASVLAELTKDPDDVVREESVSDSIDE